MQMLNDILIYCGECLCLTEKTVSNFEEHCNTFTRIDFTKEIMGRHFTLSFAILENSIFNETIPKLTTAEMGLI